MTKVSRNLFMVLSVLVVGPSAAAQVNTEKERITAQDAGLSGSVTLSILLERGNSELTEVQFEPRLVWQRGKHTIMSINDLSFVESGEGSIVDDGFSHLRYNYRVRRRVIGEAFIQGQYDRSQDLSQRFLVGGGVRLMALDRVNSTAAIGFAIMQEHEELVSGESTNLARNSNYVSMRFRKGDRFTLGTITYVQPAIENLDDLRVLSEIKCTAWITKVIGMTSSLTYHYDSEPPEGVREYNLEITSGVTFKF